MNWHHSTIRSIKTLLVSAGVLISSNVEAQATARTNMDQYLTAGHLNMLLQGNASDALVGRYYIRGAIEGTLLGGKALTAPLGDNPACTDMQLIRMPIDGMVDKIEGAIAKLGNESIKLGSIELHRKTGVAYFVIMFTRQECAKRWF